jgi:hypothetical protein
MPILIYEDVSQGIGKALANDVAAQPIRFFLFDLLGVSVAPSLP